MTEVNQTVSDQGITLSITDAYYDGIQISLSYILKLEQGIDAVDSLPHINLAHSRANLRSIDGSGSGTRKIIDNKHYAGIRSIYPSNKLPDAFYLSLSFDQIGDTEGSWQFRFPVSKKATDAASQVFTPDVTTTWDHTTVHVDQVILTPSSTAIQLTT